MSDFNKVILIGRIGNDLELKTSAQGKPYVKISLATDALPRGPGEEKGTYWHRVMAFGSTAENCVHYLRKGSQICVEGFLEVRTYTDKADNKKRTTVSVIARGVQFLDTRRPAEADPAMAASA